MCRPERLLPVVEEKIVQHRGVYDCVAWIVCVLAVPWDVCLRLNVLELGSFGIRGLKASTSPRQALNLHKFRALAKFEHCFDELVYTSLGLYDRLCQHIGWSADYAIRFVDHDRVHCAAHVFGAFSF